MIRFVAIIVILMVTCFAESILNELPVDYTGYKVVKVDIKSNSEIQLLKEIKNEFQVELWNNPNLVVGYSMVLIPPGLVDSLEKRFKKDGLKSEIAIKDFQVAIEKERAEISSFQQEYAAVKPSINGFNYAMYHKLDEINKFIEQATGQYPQLAESVVIGKSYENRSITAMRISTGEAGTRPVVFLECGIHPREWVSTATGLYIIGQLLQNFSNDSATQNLLNKYEWYVIPAVNPDGYHFTHTKDRNWRKTRSKSSVLRNCIGADANRNFDSNFCGVGSSKNPCDEEYCGDYAFSEPEALALKEFTKMLGSRLKIYFSLHNFSQLWMYPYARTKDEAPNAAELNSLAQIGVAALKAVNGKTFEVGQISRIIYEASGSSVDWIYDNIGTRIAFALELRDRGVFGFMLPPGQILPTVKETWAGIKATVEAANI